MKKTAQRNLACQECGNNISAEAMFCERCHAPIVRRYCAGCSKLVPENSAFCPFCGTSSKTVVKERPNLTSTLIPAVVGLTVLMIFIGKHEAKVRHAASISGYTAGSGGTGQQYPLVAPAAPVKATASPSAPISSSAEAGRQLNLQAHDLMKQRRFNEAIPMLKRALQSFGENSRDEAYPYALFNLAQSLRLIGKPEKALPIIEKVNTLNSQQPLFQSELAATKNALATKTASSSPANN